LKNSSKEILKIFAAGFIDRYRLYRQKKHLASQFPSVRFIGDAFADDSCCFEENVTVGVETRLTSCKVGRYTYFSNHTFLNNCNVGAFCSIGPNVHAGLGIHPTRQFVTTHPSFYSPNPLVHSGNFHKMDQYSDHQPINLGNDIWIGHSSILLDGISVGSGAIIGAGAVVTKDVEPYAVVGGIPARLIRKRFDDHQIDFLLSFRWWEKDDAWLHRYGHLFNDIELFVNFFSQPSRSTR